MKKRYWFSIEDIYKDVDPFRRPTWRSQTGAIQAREETKWSVASAILSKHPSRSSSQIAADFLRARQVPRRSLASQMIAKRQSKGGRKSLGPALPSRSSVEAPLMSVSPARMDNPRTSMLAQPSRMSMAPERKSVAPTEVVRQTRFQEPETEEEKRKRRSSAYPARDENKHQINSDSFETLRHQTDLNDNKSPETKGSRKNISRRSPKTKTRSFTTMISTSTLWSVPDHIYGNSSDLSKHGNGSRDRLSAGSGKKPDSENGLEKSRLQNHPRRTQNAPSRSNVWTKHSRRRDGSSGKNRSWSRNAEKRCSSRGLRRYAFSGPDRGSSTASDDGGLLRMVAGDTDDDEEDSKRRVDRRKGNALDFDDDLHRYQDDFEHFFQEEAKYFDDFEEEEGDGDDHNHIFNKNHNNNNNNTNNNNSNNSDNNVKIHSADDTIEEKNRCALLPPIDVAVDARLSRRIQTPDFEGDAAEMAFLKVDERTLLRTASTPTRLTSIPQESRLNSSRRNSLRSRRSWPYPGNSVVGDASTEPGPPKTVLRSGSSSAESCRKPPIPPKRVLKLPQLKTSKDDLESQDHVDGRRNPWVSEGKALTRDEILKKMKKCKKN